MQDASADRKAKVLNEGTAQVALQKPRDGHRRLLAGLERGGQAKNSERVHGLHAYEGRAMRGTSANGC